MFCWKPGRVAVGAPAGNSASSSRKQALPPASFPAIARDEPLRPHYPRWCALPLNSLASAAPPGYRQRSCSDLRQEHLVQAHLSLCGLWLSIWHVCCNPDHQQIRNSQYVGKHTKAPGSDAPGPLVYAFWWKGEITL